MMPNQSERERSLMNKSERGVSGSCEVRLLAPVSTRASNALILVSRDLQNSCENIILHKFKKSWQESGGSAKYEEDCEGSVAAFRTIRRRAVLSGYSWLMRHATFGCRCGRNRAVTSGRV